MLAESNIVIIPAQGFQVDYYGSSINEGTQVGGRGVQTSVTMYEGLKGVNLMQQL